MPSCVYYYAVYQYNCTSSVHTHPLISDVVAQDKPVHHTHHLFSIYVQYNFHLNCSSNDCLPVVCVRVNNLPTLTV